ncbi:MAG: hypothetical protein A3I75_02685 [Deltaproteobacteria bacterium RIFCSPLOWO2_02_FULL_50_16]|nr:MAG: hypothetical protein A3I75_02685 [Deltaproteobacteria bacterium RIFCSPLOWO2_02_FULL_50_16]OGQ66012.1 MAG: hypothetical protein A3F89_04690 [Deltaproteobacteria bacterium RIFCSPLOWO2_12_FULL_50_11]
MKFVQFSTTLMLLCVLVAGCGNDTTSDDAADNTNVAQEGSEGVNDAAASAAVSGLQEASALRLALVTPDGLKDVTFSGQVSGASSGTSSYSGELTVTGGTANFELTLTFDDFQASEDLSPITGDVSLGISLDVTSSNSGDFSFNFNGQVQVLYGSQTYTLVMDYSTTGTISGSTVTGTNSGTITVQNSNGNTLATCTVGGTVAEPTVDC